MLLNRMVHIFTLNILVQPLNNFSPSINVTSIPMVGSQPGSGGICYNNRDDGQIYCCDHLHLEIFQLFQFPEEDFAMVISTSTTNEARLQMWRHLQANEGLAIPSSFVTNSSSEIRRCANCSMADSQMFQVVKLLIGGK